LAVYVEEIDVRNQWIVTGFQEGRRDSYAAMSSSRDKVMPMSSSPSSNRQRV